MALYQVPFPDGAWKKEMALRCRKTASVSPSAIPSSCPVFLRPASSSWSPSCFDRGGRCSPSAAGNWERIAPSAKWVRRRGRP